jgi:hypothetical protein
MNEDKTILLGSLGEFILSFTASTINIYHTRANIFMELEQA